MAERRPARVSLRERMRGGQGVVRFSTAYLLGAILLFIGAAPFVDRYAAATVLDEVVATLVLACAVIAVGARRRTLILSIVIAFPALAGQWLHQAWPDAFPWEIVLSASLLFTAFIIVCLFRFIFSAPRVDAEVLCAAVAGYLLIGILWSYVFALEERCLPGSFAFNAGPDASRAMQGFTPLYFSFVTLTTVGYGNIAPTNDVARLLAILEAIVGVFYLAILISRLVSLQTSARTVDRSDDPR